MRERARILLFAMLILISMNIPCFAKAGNVEERSLVSLSIDVPQGFSEDIILEFENVKNADQKFLITLSPRSQFSTLVSLPYGEYKAVSAEFMSKDTYEVIIDNLILDNTSKDTMQISAVLKELEAKTKPEEIVSAETVTIPNVDTELASSNESDSITTNISSKVLILVLCIVIGVALFIYALYKFNKSKDNKKEKKSRKTRTHSITRCFAFFLSLALSLSSFMGISKPLVSYGAETIIEPQFGYYGTYTFTSYTGNHYGKEPMNKARLSVGCSYDSIYIAVSSGQYGFAFSKITGQKNQSTLYESTSIEGMQLTEDNATRVTTFYRNGTYYGDSIINYLNSIGYTAPSKGNETKYNYYDINMGDAYHLFDNFKELPDLSSAFKSSFTYAGNYSEIAKNNQLTVTNTNGGTTNNKSGIYAVGAPVNVIATENSGYYFDGWYVGELKVSGDANYTFSMPAYPYTIQAKFLPRTYQVSFNTNGGSNLSPKNVIFNTVYGDLPTTSKEGHIFSHWTYLNTAINSSSIFNIPSNITLNAEFNVNYYEVQLYDLGEGGSGDKAHPYGSDVTIFAGNKLGFYFDRWEVVDNTISLSDPTKATLNFNMPAKKVIVNAKWKQIKNISVVLNELFNNTYGHLVNESGAYNIDTPMTISKDMVDVVINLSDGSKIPTTNFTVSNNVISKVGDNQVSIKVPEVDYFSHVTITGFSSTFNDIMGDLGLASDDYSGLAGWINNAKSELTSLKKDLASYQNMITELERILSNAGENIENKDTLEEKLQAALDGVISLVSKINDYDTKFARIQAFVKEILNSTGGNVVDGTDFDSLIANLSELQSNVTTMKNELEQANLIIEELRKQLDEKDKTIVELQKQLDDAREWIANATEEIKNLNGDITSYKNMITELESILTNAGESIENKETLEQQLQAALSGVASLVNKLNDYEVKFNQMQQLVINLIESIGGNVSDGADVNDLFIQLQVQINELNQTIESLKAEVSGMKSQLEEANTTIENLKNELEIRDMTIEELKRKVLEVQAINSQLKKNEEILQAENSELKNEKEMMIQNTILLESENKQIKDTNSQLQNQINDLNLTVEKLRDENSNTATTETINKELQNKVEELEQANKDLENAISLLQDNIANKESEISKEINKNNQLETDVNQKNKELEDTQSRLESTIESTENYKNKCDILSNEITKLKEEIEIVQANYEDAKKNETSGTEELIIDYENQLNLLNNQIASLESEVIKLKGKKVNIESNEVKFDGVVNNIAFKNDSNGVTVSSEDGYKVVNIDEWATSSGILLSKNDYLLANGDEFAWSSTLNVLLQENKVHSSSEKSVLEDVEFYAINYVNGDKIKYVINKVIYDKSKEESNIAITNSNQSSVSYAFIQDLTLREISDVEWLKTESGQIPLDGYMGYVIIKPSNNY